MIVERRNEYMQIMRERREATKAERSALPDEVCPTRTCSRKHTIALLSPNRDSPQSSSATTSRRSFSGAGRGRPRRYDDPRDQNAPHEAVESGVSSLRDAHARHDPLWLQFDATRRPEHIARLL